MKSFNSSLRGGAEAASDPDGTSKSKEVGTEVRMKIGMELRNR